MQSVVDRLFRWQQPKRRVNMYRFLICLATLTLATPYSLAGAKELKTLHLRLENTSNSPAYFRVEKLGPLEDNGARVPLGEVACMSSDDKPLTTGVVPAQGNVKCGVNDISAGNRVEITRISEGKTAVIRSFDIPKKKKYLKVYSFGSDTNPINVSVDAPAVRELTAEEATNNIMRMATSVNMQAGFQPIPVKQYDRYCGHFFVAKVNNSEDPIDASFNGAYDVSSPLDKTRDFPLDEFITPIRYSNSLLTSAAAKATMDAKFPAVASISLGVGAQSYSELRVTAKWYNFRISKTISEALSNVKQQDRDAILGQLQADPQSRLFYVNGFSAIKSFEFNYKTAMTATSSNKVEFVAGGAALTFDLSKESTNNVALEDSIVALSRQSLGNAQTVGKMFTSVPSASIPPPKPLAVDVQEKINKVIRDVERSRQ